MDRRDFLKAAALGALATQYALAGTSTPASKSSGLARGDWPMWRQNVRMTG